MIAAKICSLVSDRLEAFVDGELCGSDRLDVARHLDACEVCRREAHALRELGDRLREWTPPEADLDRQTLGLGARVLGRVQAEERLSWRSWFERAVDGWHWAIVGTGSVVGTLLSTSVLSLVLAFGPAPVREDSLSALMGNLASPPGYMFVLVSAVSDNELALLQIANGQPTASRMVAALATAGPCGRPAPLSGAVRRVEGFDGDAQRLRERRAGDFDARGCRGDLDEITNLRVGSGGVGAVVQRVVNVRGVRLVTSVTAKG
jgi:hypothetical protein